MEDLGGMIAEAGDGFVAGGVEVNEDVEEGAEEAVFGGIIWGWGGDGGEVGGGDRLTLETAGGDGAFAVVVGGVCVGVVW